MKIKSIEDLKRIYPKLVMEIEESVLERLRIAANEKKGLLTESEREIIRRKAKRLAGI